MGKVISMFATRRKLLHEPNKYARGSAQCPCGWRVPRNVAIELAAGGTLLQVQFDCPECARRLNLCLDDRT
jgi:hypothetical protein